MQVNGLDPSFQRETTAIEKIDNLEKGLAHLQKQRKKWKPTVAEKIRFNGYQLEVATHLNVVTILKENIALLVVEENYQKALSHLEAVQDLTKYFDAQDNTLRMCEHLLQEIEDIRKKSFTTHNLNCGQKTKDSHHPF